ncbi:MAG: single-stranded DNA-binding protein [Flavobacteriales bacterium]|jgi:single-strand DNA-binding protein
MAGSVNKVILIGNLGRDPESKTFDNGGMIVNLNLATSETYKNQAGEKETKTEWHRLVIKRPQLCEIAMKYLKKGMSIYAEGKLVTRQWTKDNVTQYTTEVVVEEFTMLTPRQNGGETTDPGATVRETEMAGNGADDLPF